MTRTRTVHEPVTSEIPVVVYDDRVTAQNLTEDQAIGNAFSYEFFLKGDPIVVNLILSHLTNHGESRRDPPLWARHAAISSHGTDFRSNISVAAGISRLIYRSENRDNTCLAYVEFFSHALIRSTLLLSRTCFSMPFRTRVIYC